MGVKHTDSTHCKQLRTDENAFANPRACSFASSAVSTTKRASSTASFWYRTAHATTHWKVNSPPPKGRHTPGRVPFFLKNEVPSFTIVLSMSLSVRTTACLFSGQITDWCVTAPHRTPHSHNTQHLPVSPHSCEWSCGSCDALHCSGPPKALAWCKLVGKCDSSPILSFARTPPDGRV